MMKFSLRILPVCALLLAVCAGCSSARPDGSGAARQLNYADQRRFDALFTEGVNRRLKEDYASAYELFAAALRLNPDAPEALYEMALLDLRFCGRNDSARIAQNELRLQRAAALAPGNKYYKETLGNFYINRENYEKAIDVYEELAEAGPSVELYGMLVRLYAQTQNFDGSIRALDRIEQLDGKSEEYSIEKFRLHIQQGDTARAFATIEELRAEYPTDLRYSVLLGDLYRENGNTDTALVIYRDVLAAEPANSYAQLSLLSLYQRLGRDSLLRATAETVVRNPETQPAVRTQVMRTTALQALHSGGDTLAAYRLLRHALLFPQPNRELAEFAASYTMAIRMPEDSLEPVMTVMLETEPDYKDARLQLMSILLRQNRLDETVEQCRKGRLYDPAELRFHYYEGLSLYSLGRDSEAIEAFRRALKEGRTSDNPQLTSDICATLGDLLHSQGRKAEAYAAYDSALTWQSDNYLCMNNYAYFLALDGERLDRAEALSRQAIEAEPQNSTYLDTYAWILYKKEQYTQARIYIDETLRHTTEAPENAGLYDHAGDIYYRCGEHAKAREFWTIALRLSTDEELSSTLRQKLKAGL